MSKKTKKHYFSNDRIEEDCEFLAEARICHILKKQYTPNKNADNDSVVFRKHSALSVVDNNTESI